MPSKRDPSLLLPQAVAHRGYKALWPENTMAAFRAAVEAAIPSPTSNDQGIPYFHPALLLPADIVFLASWIQDATLTRCFGIDRALRDCTWESLSGVQTIRQPRQGLPRLRDLLAWLVEEDKLAAEEDHERVRPWVLLDIKLDDDAEHIVEAIRVAISQVDASPDAPWEKRILLGCWNASVLQACHRLLPSHPLVHIGYSLSYAGQFLPLPHVSFNMAFHTLARPFSSHRFMRRLANQHRALFAWTVNHPRWMRWCVRQNTRYRDGPLIDGVVTDDPALYLAIRARYEAELHGVGDSQGMEDHSGRRAKALLGYCTETLGMVVDMATRSVGMTLRFWYRRFVERKLDDLDGRGRRVKKE
ncbi:hypothetical protein E4U21_003486 [Claviceps maximensis]|nr:hypothetical protein E4U21_003486 [Claviceps maximensis]